MRRKLAAAGVLIGLLLAWLGLALWRSLSAPAGSQTVSVASPRAGRAAGPPVELEFAILKIPAAARSQKTVQKLLEGVGPEAAALPPERARLLWDQALLAIAPAYVSVVSRPRVVVLSGTEAEVTIAENVPFGSSAKPVRGNLVLRVAPDLAPDGAATLGIALSLSRTEGTIAVVLDAAGLPVARRASGSGLITTAPGGSVAFTCSLGGDEILVIATPRPAPGPAALPAPAPPSGPGTSPAP